MFSSINFYLSSIYFYLILKSHIFIDFAAKGPGKPMNIKMQFTLKNGRTKIVGMYSKTLKGAIIALSHIWWRNFCNTKNITQLDGDKIQPLGYMWCKPKNVTQKKGNGAQKYVHIFKRNALTWCRLRSYVYQGLDSFSSSCVMFSWSKT